MPQFQRQHPYSIAFQPRVPAAVLNRSDLSISAIEAYEQGTYTLKVNQPVTITWKQAPPTGLDIGFEGEKYNMGSVENTTSGVTFNWTASGDIYPFALIYAISQRPDATYAMSQGYLSIEIVNYLHASNPPHFLMGEIPHKNLPFNKCIDDIRY